jgi:uncharacterized protein YndB with AHSA1/START domain
MQKIEGDRSMNQKTLIAFAFSCVALLCLSDTVRADTRTVETTFFIPASPERVLRSFVDEEDLQGWWKVSRTLVEEHSGGVWSVVWDDYGVDQTQHTWVGVVEELSPRRLRVSHLVMIEPGRPLYGPLQLEVTVTPAPGGSSLTVLHHGYQNGHEWDWIHDTVVRGWRHVLTDMQNWFQDGASAPEHRH